MCGSLPSAVCPSGQPKVASETPYITVLQCCSIWNRGGRVANVCHLSHRVEEDHWRRPSAVAATARLWISACCLCPHQCTVLPGLTGCTRAESPHAQHPPTDLPFFFSPFFTSTPCTAWMDLLPAEIQPYMVARIMAPIKANPEKAFPDINELDKTYGSSPDVRFFVAELPDDLVKSALQGQPATAGAAETSPAPKVDVADDQPAPGYQVVGCVAIKRRNSQEGELCRMAVQSGIRQQGIGSKLFKAAVDFARSRHFLRLYLVTGNMLAAKFYAAHGFYKFYGPSFPVKTDEGGWTLFVFFFRKAQAYHWGNSATHSFQ